jgi:NADH-quinone oxidoreductase subunit L
MLVPLGILAFLAAISGLPDLLTTLFKVPSLYEYLQTALPENSISLSLPVKAWAMQIFYAAISLVAFAFTYFFYARSARRAAAVVKTSVGYALRAWLFAGFGFDWLYYNLVVYPYIALMQLNRRDVMDWLTKANVYAFRGSNVVLSRIENGNLRWYVGGIGIGAVILLALVILL